MPVQFFNVSTFYIYRMLQIQNQDPHNFSLLSIEMVQSDKDATVLGMVLDNLPIITISGHNQPFKAKVCHFFHGIWN